jgi:hypothetical protein
MLQARTYGDSSFTLSATAPGGTVTYTSLSANISINGNQVTILGAGAATITATQSGGGGYLAAKPVTRKITILKAAQSVTMNDPGSVIFGSGPVSLTASSSTGSPVTFKSSNPKVARIVSANSGNSLSLLGVGSSMITASVSASPNYLATSTSRTLTVTRASQSVNPFNPVPDITLGGVPIIQTPTASSGLPVKLSVASGPAKYVKGKLKIIGTGAVTISASQPGNTKYQPAPVIFVSFEVRP